MYDPDYPLGKEVYTYKISTLYFIHVSLIFHRFKKCDYYHDSINFIELLLLCMHRL